MLYPTAEVCEICDLKLCTLTSWVQRGLVTPKVWGAKGGGQSHRYSERQVLALAVLAGNVEIGCASASNIEYVMTTFESMSDAELDSLLETKTPWSEEHTATFENRVHGGPVREQVLTEVQKRLIAPVRRRIDNAQLQLHKRRQLTKKRLRLTERQHK